MEEPVVQERSRVNEFSPQKACPLRFFAGITLDSIGNLYVIDTPNVNSKIRKITPAGVVSTFIDEAGVLGGLSDPAAPALWGTLLGIAIDSSNNLYLAETERGRIIKISSGGSISILAGSGTSGDYVDGTGTAAGFSLPASMAVDAAGFIYVTDSYRVRKISPSGMVSTLAGSGSSGNSIDGQGSGASFGIMSDIAVNSAGYVYVTEWYNHTIRKISPSGVVTTIGGARVEGQRDGVGATARFSNPAGIAVDA